jgi:hypothetical protein
VKGHSRIDNPERHMHYWSQDTERRQIKQKTQHRILKLFRTRTSLNLGGESMYSQRIPDKTPAVLLIAI